MSVFLHSLLHFNSQPPISNFHFLSFSFHFQTSSLLPPTSNLNFLSFSPFSTLHAPTSFLLFSSGPSGISPSSQRGIDVGMSCKAPCVIPEGTTRCRCIALSSSRPHSGDVPCCQAVIRAQKVLFIVLCSALGSFPLFLHFSLFVSFTFSYFPCLSMFLFLFFSVPFSLLLFRFLTLSSSSLEVVASIHHFWNWCPPAILFRTGVLLTYSLEVVASIHPFWNWCPPSILVS